MLKYDGLHQLDCADDMGLKVYNLPGVVLG
jgi:hypothetical protein